MMAKKKAAVTGRPIGITRGRAVAEELARYYETGQQIKKSIGGHHRPGEKVRVDGETREKLMAEHGISQDQFYKMLDFACLYSQNEFRALRRHVNSETQEPLHWTHVRTLLAFSRDQVEQRTKCEKLAIKNGWSARLLLTTTRENREDLKALSKAAARISELAGKLAERAAKQRSSRRKPPNGTGAANS